MATFDVSGSLPVYAEARIPEDSRVIRSRAWMLSCHEVWGGWAIVSCKAVASIFLSLSRRDNLPSSSINFVTHRREGEEVGVFVFLEAVDLLTGASVRNASRERPRRYGDGLVLSFVSAVAANLVDLVTAGFHCLSTRPRIILIPQHKWKRLVCGLTRL